MLIGKYQLDAVTPLGPKKGSITIDTAEDGKITGTMEMLDGNYDIERGTFDGDTFEFRTTVKAFGMTFPFVCKGSVDGDAITLSMDNPMAKVSAKGTRQNTAW